MTKRLLYLDEAVEDQLTHLVAELYSIRKSLKKLKRLDKATEKMYNELMAQQEECRKQLQSIRANLHILRTIER